MTPLIMFRKAYDDSIEPKYGILQGQSKKPVEKIGPSNYEKYAYISGSTNEASTFPHIDVFKTLNDVYSDLPAAKRDHCNIVLSGSTHQYTVNVYGNNITSLNQYFLEHPTREGKLQYLIFVDEGEVSPLYRFKVFVPGLLYDSSDNNNGEVLGYLNSHVANSENKVIVELPYGLSDEDYNGYHFLEIEPSNVSRNGNIVTLSNILTEYNIILSHNSSSASFKLFPYNSDNGTHEFIVKNINEFGDYTIAAQLTSNNIKDVVNLLSGLEEKQIVLPPKPDEGQTIIREYFPTTFISLLNNTPSEEVNNITPNLYNVPAAFVPINDNNKVFMTDVLGVSTNKILNGAIL